MDKSQPTETVRITVQIPASLAAKIELARGKESIMDFVRLSIASRLGEKGLPLKKNEQLELERTGKRGPKPKDKPERIRLRKRVSIWRVS